jgi:hypothetical protein
MTSTPMQACGITSLILFTVPYIFRVGNDASSVSKSHYFQIVAEYENAAQSPAFRNKFYRFVFQ